MVKAGVSEINITPQNALQLCGYPFVERISTGTNDPLLASALYLSSGPAEVLFISCDLLYVENKLSASVRKKIEQRFGIPEFNILISATHTHSGPATVQFAAGSYDTSLKPVDKDYLIFLEDQLLQVAITAIENKQAAEVACFLANGKGLGTNRHDPDGPSDLSMPVLIVRDKNKEEVLACMVVCSMHPTVLHEDSTLYSGDFPGMARAILKEKYFTETTAFLFQMGTSGNQSPRYVTKSNTFEEAGRLGDILSTAIGEKLTELPFSDHITIKATAGTVELVRKNFLTTAEAREYEEKCRMVFGNLKNEKAAPQLVRTAEVNWFGAKELQHLSELSATGVLESLWKERQEVVVSVFKIGDFLFVGWPGEIFVEYGLEIKSAFPNAAVITLANAELQGYIVTPEAAAAGVYEASNAIFDATSGALLVKKTIDLINTIA